MIWQAHKLDVGFGEFLTAFPKAVSITSMSWAWQGAGIRPSSSPWLAASGLSHARRRRQCRRQTRAASCIDLSLIVADALFSIAFVCWTSDMESQAQDSEAVIDIRQV